MVNPGCDAARQMITVRSLAELRELDLEVSFALGVFDGVHLGHQAVIGAARQQAKTAGCKTGVLTFSPHPIQVLAPDRAPNRILANLAHKEELLAQMQVDVLVVMTFDEEFAAREAEDFLQELIDSCELKGIAVGEDWRFGKDRRGDGAMLRAAAEKSGYALSLVPPVMQGGERISSTRIRQAIRDGNLASIEAMLGRRYSIRGRVERGRQIGRTIGFPTANIDPHSEQLPPAGVWSVRMKIDGEWRQAIANLGQRPTVEDAPVQRRLEVHLFDFDDDLYDREFEIEFLRYVRAEKKFAGLDELKAQIAADCESVRSNPV